MQPLELSRIDENLSSIEWFLRIGAKLHPRIDAHLSLERRNTATTVLAHRTYLSQKTFDALDSEIRSLGSSPYGVTHQEASYPGIDLIRL